MATLRVDTSAFQPTAVRPKKGIGSEMNISAKMAYRGVPSGAVSPILAGSRPSSAMVTSTRAEA